MYVWSGRLWTVLQFEKKAINVGFFSASSIRPLNFSLIIKPWKFCERDQWGRDRHKKKEALSRMKTCPLCVRAKHECVGLCVDLKAALLAVCSVVPCHSDYLLCLYVCLQACRLHAPCDITAQCAPAVMNINKNVQQMFVVKTCQIYWMLCAASSRRSCFTPTSENLGSFLMKPTQSHEVITRPITSALLAAYRKVPF